MHSICTALAIASIKLKHILFRNLRFGTMALPVDNAGIEDVTLEALPSESSSALRDTAASPGTGSGDSESVP